MKAFAVFVAILCTLISPYTRSVYAQVSGVRCEDVRPLISWYSNHREDNFETTDPRWGGPLGVQRSPDYKAYRNEGYIWVTQRPGTIPLYRWYSSERGDNFLTSDPRWAGRSGDVKSGYRFSRLEGYIFDPNHPQPANTLPLDRSYSDGRDDNFASSHPMWTGPIGKPNLPDYTLSRHEGYVFDPRYFAGCIYPIDEQDNLPDFVVTNIQRSPDRFLWVPINNEGASGFVTAVECYTLGSAVSKTERFALARNVSQTVRMSIWPAEGSEVTCVVKGVAADGITPEPSGTNNSLTKVPTF